MDQERWTPDTSRTDVLDGDPHEWPTLPTATYLGDPRWGIRADLPATPARSGMPEPDPTTSAPMHTAIGPVRATPTPVARTAPGAVPGMVPGAARSTVTTTVPGGSRPAVPAPRTAPPIAAVPGFPAPPAPPAPVPASVPSPRSAQPSFGPPSFAPAVVGPRPSGPSSVVGPRPVSPAFAPVPAAATVPLTERRSARRGWLTALAIVLVLGVIGAAVAVVGLPMLLHSGNTAALAPLRADLTLVAAAETAVHAQTGTYSADPSVVAGQLRGAVTSQVVILRADTDDWCGEAMPAGETAPTLYFSERAGFSEQSCA